MDSSSDSDFLINENPYFSPHFTNITLLVEGRICRIFKALRLGKWHVLKCLLPQYDQAPEYLTALQKEFDISFQLTHPNIVNTIAMEKVENLGICIVMEYIEGRTLRQVMKEESWNSKRTITFLQELCSALDYIHNKQIVHRDIKPENILLTTNGDHVKLIDFGSSDADAFSIHKGPAGTRHYAAPEVKNGLTIDQRADIYSLGVMMQEIPNLTNKLQRIAQTCSKADKEKRYATAKDVSQALVRKHPLWLYLLEAAIPLTILCLWVMIGKMHKTNTIYPSALTDSTKTVYQGSSLESEKNDIFLVPEQNEEKQRVEAVPVLSAVSPDVAFFLNKTAIPDSVKNEPRFVHLAEYAYSVTMHFLKTHSINYDAEGEAFGYVQKEIYKTMGKDPRTAEKYLHYLDVLTQIIAEDYQQEHLGRSVVNSIAPSKEMLHRIEIYAKDWVPFHYRITNVGENAPSTTNDQEVITEMERQVQHLVGIDDPFYQDYIKHAHAAAQKVMSERRELWKSSGQWRDTTAFSYFR